MTHCSPPSRRSAAAAPAVLLAASVLAGCAFFSAAPTVPPPASPNADYVIATPFVEADFAPYGGSGNASIMGRAFMVRRDGEVVPAAGQQVVLVPWNAYTREIRAAAEAGYQGLANRDARYSRYRRTTTADGDGRFAFSGLPGGDWSLMTSVFWQEAGQRLGDFLYENVRVAPGGRADVTVSRRL